MKKIIVIVCLFSSLYTYAQIDDKSIDVLKGISENEESQIKGTREFRRDKLSLLYETFDVRVLHKNEVVTLSTYEVFPQIKRITKIKKIIIFNAQEKEVVIQNFDSPEVIINTQDLPFGTYNIYIKTDNGQVNKQFTKK